MKHTAGPWYAENSGSIRRVKTDEDGDPFLIAGIKNRSIQTPQSPFSHPKGEEAKANANLIAAAPELLEVCKVIAESYEGARNTPEYMPELQAAINKARGMK